MPEREEMADTIWAALKGDPCRCKFAEPEIRTVQIYSVGSPVRSMKTYQDPSKSTRIHQNPSRSIRVFEIEGRPPTDLLGRQPLNAAPSGSQFDRLIYDES